jgi:hypothetical protein
MSPASVAEGHWRPAQWPAATEAELTKMIRDERKKPEGERSRVVTYSRPIHGTGVGMGDKTGVSQTCVIAWHPTAKCYTVTPPDHYVMTIRKAPTAADDSEDSSGDEGDEIMETAGGAVP